MKKSRQKNNTVDLIDEEALMVPPPPKRRGRTPKENYFFANCVFKYTRINAR
jgi:hypothetical protein